MANDSNPRRAEPEVALPPFYVVGIGASSGGLGALRTLFGAMPAKPGIAFVVVVHLSPEHESHLVELLQPCTQMPVCQVKETVELRPDQVYVIPPNANLNTIDTHLRLSALEARRIERAPIDHFLRTLARTHDGGAVGVILTGAGSDGALGLRQIKERGGLTIAQDPVEAEFDGMPRAAIATGMVDLVVSLRDIPTRLLSFCSTRPRLPVADGENGLGDEDRAVLEQIVGELRTRTGRDFSVFTRAMMLSRMRTRMQLRNTDTLSAYLDALRSAPDEAGALCRDLLTTVTEFFSEPGVFDYLAQHLLPSLFDRKREIQDRLRIWSIGCSTGEEAYSLAMLLLEEAERRERHPVLQVFASDLSADALKTARDGVYPIQVGATVSPERLERFFEQEGGHLRVRRELHEIVTFAAHDLFKDPPYAHLDLIVCRTLLSELQPAVRRGVLSLFHYALEPHGTLIVGPQDDLRELDLFVPEDKPDCVYRRRSGPRPPLVLPTVMRPFGRDEGWMESSAAAPVPATARYPAAVFHRVMERHTPASVLIDADNWVLHYSTHVSRYLRLPGGVLTHDLPQLVREPIRSHLLQALDQVRRTGRPWSSAPFDVPGDHGSRSLTLSVDTVPGAESPGWLLVVFDEQPTMGAAADAEELRAPGSSVRRLRKELEQADQRLQILLTAQAADDVVQVANDELRRIVEELQSSREELQAVNEELITLDAENRQRLRQLSETSADLQHLLESTGIATLFIDRELRIVRFTPQLAELFNVRYSDVGRPLSDLTHELHYDELEADARHVLEHLVAVDREVAGSRDRCYLSRMLPYRTTARHVDGVVLTLIDITQRKRAEDELRLADRRKDEFLAMLAHELRNPLAPIASGIEVLRKASGEPQTVERLSAMMGRQAQQLIRLVDDLLEVSRISGGKLRLHMEPVRLMGVIQDAITAARPLIDSLGHQLTLITPQEPVAVNADAVRLTQVIANLLNNAARYTPPGGQIELAMEAQAGVATVTVKDNGVGIDMDAMGHLFDMFYQGNSARALPNGGLGIGLALAKSLIELHGGTITAASGGSQRGSEFKVNLPTTGAAPSNAETTARQASFDNRGRRVLIVDDNRDAAETLSALIKALGDKDVHTASNGCEALRKSAELHPQLILLDLLMPDMDGFEVARRIRKEPWGKDITMVALTGWGSEEHRRRSREAGFDGHLTKPVDMSALRAVLAKPGAAEQQLA